MNPRCKKSWQFLLWLVFYLGPHAKISSLVSTHYISQPIYIDEKGKLKIIQDFDERTIWTSDRIPLIASYNRGSCITSFILSAIYFRSMKLKWKPWRWCLIPIVHTDKMLHSLWIAENASPCPGEERISTTHVLNIANFPRRFSFRRIWQAKGSHMAASKVPIL